MSFQTWFLSPRTTIVPGVENFPRASMSCFSGDLAHAVITVLRPLKSTVRKYISPRINFASSCFPTIDWFWQQAVSPAIQGLSMESQSLNMWWCAHTLLIYTFSVLEWDCHPNYVKMMHMGEMWWCMCRVLWLKAVTKNCSCHSKVLPAVVLVPEQNK